jgi:hypothetical protein
MMQSYVIPAHVISQDYYEVGALASWQWRHCWLLHWPCGQACLQQQQAAATAHI